MPLQKKEEPLAEEISRNFLKGREGKVFLKNIQRRYALGYVDIYGFLDLTGLCLGAFPLSEDSDLLSFQKLENRRFQDLFPSKLESNILFYLRYTLQKQVPLFRLFEHQISGKPHTFVTIFIHTPFLVETKPVIAFFAQHISSTGNPLFLEDEHESFQRHEIIREIQSHGKLTLWAKKELLFLGLSPETRYLTCLMVKRDLPEPLRRDSSWLLRLSRYLLRDRELFCWNFDRGLGVLLPQEEGPLSSEEEQKNQAFLLLELCEEFFPGQSFSAGLAKMPRPLSKLCLSLQEAERASRGSLFGLTQKVVHFGEIGYGAFLTPRSQDWQHFMQHTLEPLLPGEGEAPVLLHSLEALLEYSSIPEAARALHIHPNTLSYRKRQIEELLQRDLQNPHVRINLFLALKARQLLQEEIAQSEGTS